MTAGVFKAAAAVLRYRGNVVGFSPDVPALAMKARRKGLTTLSFHFNVPGIVDTLDNGVPWRAPPPPPCDPNGPKNRAERRALARRRR